MASKFWLALPLATLLILGCKDNDPPPRPPCQDEIDLAKTVWNARIDSFAQLEADLRVQLDSLQRRNWKLVDSVKGLGIKPWGK